MEGAAVGLGLWLRISRDKHFLDRLTVEGEADMTHVEGIPGQFPRRLLLPAGALAAGLVLLLGASRGDEAAVDLRIGLSNKLTGDAGPKEEKGAVNSLQSFIKDEVNMTNRIDHARDWRDLADKMAKGKFQVGVFQGYELAWAQGKYKGLKLLALGVNVHRYPVACAVVKRDSPIRDFAALRGATLAFPSEKPYLRLWVTRTCEASGKKMAEFFGKVTSPKSIEDGLDDVVDGIVKATVVDRAALEAFQERKPGRFEKLKEVAKSAPFPPLVVVYQAGSLDEATVKRLRKGLLEASGKERASLRLAMARLTAFQNVPEDFSAVLARSLKTYPPESKK
jgi:ABC-type phosphate/phosphonate transport system substrate-binding protein